MQQGVVVQAIVGFFASPQLPEDHTKREDVHLSKGAVSPVHLDVLCGPSSAIGVVPFIAC